MTPVQYKYGKAVDAKRMTARRFTDEALIAEIQKEYLNMVTFGYYQIKDFPFKMIGNELHLMPEGEWYQVVKEEILQRMS